MATLTPRKAVRNPSSEPMTKRSSAKPKPLAKKPLAKKSTPALAIAEPAPKQPTLSPRGRVLGRPRLTRAPLGQVQTRIPTGLADYLKILALERLPDQPAPFRTMQRMFEALFERFLNDEPWKAGLAWRESHAVARFSAGSMTERTEWKQINIQLPTALVVQVEAAAAATCRSQSSFCYTALCWWAGLLYPPVAARGRG